MSQTAYMHQPGQRVRRRGPRGPGAQWCPENRRQWRTFQRELAAERAAREANAGPEVYQGHRGRGRPEGVAAAV